jgi:hypothetical protein
VDNYAGFWVSLSIVKLKNFASALHIKIEGNGILTNEFIMLQCWVCGGHLAQTKK